MKKIVLASLLMALAVAGCEQMGYSRDEKSAPAPEASRGSESLQKSAVKNENETAESPSAVEAALTWAQRYSEATAKVEKLQQENRDIAAKNQQLQDQVQKLQMELDVTQKELSAANKMLLEMRVNLEKWQASVLGYRQEMREAQQAQLAALSRILRLLGGEVTSPSSQPGEHAPTEKKETASEPAEASH
jgi:septal ring factor EnvC (AmiA/AmiB activator)